MKANRSVHRRLKTFDTPVEGGSHARLTANGDGAKPRNS